jgi:hypothetical protein
MRDTSRMFCGSVSSFNILLRTKRISVETHRLGLNRGSNITTMFFPICFKDLSRRFCPDLSLSKEGHLCLFLKEEQGCYFVPGLSELCLPLPSERFWLPWGTRHTKAPTSQRAGKSEPYLEFHLTLHPCSGGSVLRLTTDFCVSPQGHSSTQCSPLALLCAWLSSIIT